MAGAALEAYLSLPNPKKPSQTRGQVFDAISALAEVVRPESKWPHSCSLAFIESWHENRLERPEGQRFNDPPGYVRADDFKYVQEKNMLNWTAHRIEQLRFDNACLYLRRLEALADGKSEASLLHDLREAVHPNKFGSTMNLESDVLKRSDWRGELRPRHCKIVAKMLHVYERADSHEPKLSLSLLGAEIRAYDAAAANTNPACDLYGMGFTDDQARRVVCIRPGATAAKRIPIFVVLPTYEARIKWHSAMQRKAEDKDAPASAGVAVAGAGSGASLGSSIKSALHGMLSGKK